MSSGQLHISVEKLQYIAQFILDSNLCTFIQHITLLTTQNRRFVGTSLVTSLVIQKLSKLG
jgi:hypothetical protein